MILLGVENSYVEKIYFWWQNKRMFKTCLSFQKFVNTKISLFSMV